MKYIFHIMSMCFEYICFMFNIVFVFLLQSHFWLIHFPPTHAFTNDMYVLSSYMCSITLGTAQICSSYSHMPGPGICCWCSDYSRCSHWNFRANALPINRSIYIYQCEHITIHHSITLLAVMWPYSPACWHTDSNYCHTSCKQSQLRFVLSVTDIASESVGMFQLDIQNFCNV